MTPTAVPLWGSLIVIYPAAMAAVMVTGILACRRRRLTTTAPALCVLMFAVGAWCLTDLVIAMAGRGWLPEAAAQVSLACALPLIAVVVVAYWVVAHAAADREWRLRRPVLLALSAHPLIVAAGAIAAPWTDVLYRSIGIDHAWAWLAWTPGPLFWAHTAYSYVLLTWSAITLARAFRHSGRLQRQQLGRLLACLLVPLPCNMISTLVLSGASTPDLTAIGFAVGGLIAADALLRHGLLQLVPVARGLVLERLTDAVIVLDTDHRLLDANLAGRTLLRAIAPHLPATPIGTRLPDVLATSPLARSPSPAANGPDPPDRRFGFDLPDGEHRLDLPDGQVVLDLRIEDLRDARGRQIGRVIVARDITELVQLRDHLAEKAIRDELTGLFNRRQLLEELEHLRAQAIVRGAPLAVLMIDIDHFKSVNDEYGHAVGDALLARIADALVDGLRGHDVVARMGGEEFVVLLPGTSLEVALARAESLRRLCAAAVVDTVTGTLSRTVSIGVAVLTPTDAGTCTAGQPTPALLLRVADQALYSAKASGRDRVAIG